MEQDRGGVGDVWGCLVRGWGGEETDGFKERERIKAQIGRNHSILGAKPAEQPSIPFRPFFLFVSSPFAYHASICGGRWAGRDLPVQCASLSSPGESFPLFLRFVGSWLSRTYVYLFSLSMHFGTVSQSKSQIASEKYVHPPIRVKRRRPGLKHHDTTTAPPSSPKCPCPPRYPHQATKTAAPAAVITRMDHVIQDTPHNPPPNPIVAGTDPAEGTTPHSHHPHPHPSPPPVGAPVHHPRRPRPHRPPPRRSGTATHRGAPTAAGGSRPPAPPSAPCAASAAVWPGSVGLQKRRGGRRANVVTNPDPHVVRTWGAPRLHVYTRQHKSTL